MLYSSFPGVFPPELSQPIVTEKDKKREKKKKKLSAKEEFKEEEIPEDLWERQEYYQVRAKSQVLLYKQREAA